jgi:MFS family permease
MPVSPESIGAAIGAGMRYIRFAPPMHAVLWRSGTFVISASALWSILPLVAKVELHSQSSGFGLLLGCLGVGSILGALIIGRLRQLFSFNFIATSSVALFGVVNVALAYLSSFSAVALVLLAAGVAWMALNSTLTTAAQTSLPAWVRARGLSVYLLIFQGAMAVGSVIWGEIATRFGLRITMLVAGAALLAAAAATSRLRLTGPRDADTTPSNHWPEPPLLVERLPEHGPVLVTVEYFIDPARGAGFTLTMQGMRRIRRRDGAVRWSLYEDASLPGRYLETFVVESWAEHLRQHSRATVADHEVETEAFAFHLGQDAPRVTHWIAARK